MDSSKKCLNRDCVKCLYFREFYSRGPKSKSHGRCTNKAHMKMVRKLDTCYHFEPA